jgi:glycosyltransferase involved in cell wall biosynthesis
MNDISGLVKPMHSPEEKLLAMPLVTVSMPAFNSEHYIAEAIESILAQTYKNFEVIIVDGLSKDNTVSIIEKYEKKFLEAKIPYIWSSEKDSGIYDAWNKALKKVNSSWIAFLGSDDTYYPDALEIYNEAIIKNPNINYISSKVEYVDANYKVLKVIVESKYDKCKTY